MFTTGLQYRRHELSTRRNHQGAVAGIDECLRDLQAAELGAAGLHPRDDLQHGDLLRHAGASWTYGH